MEILFSRKKKDGIHMNSHVGRVSLCDGEGRSTFEFGVTDLQRMSSGKKKRELGVQHLYVKAQGSRANT